MLTVYINPRLERTEATFLRPFSDMGDSGSLYTSSTFPIMAKAALTGIGLDSTKFTFING